jgi:hypothetical protein
MKNQQELLLTTGHPVLDAAVQDVYAVFAHHRAPDHTLDVCLECCVDESVERELRQWPLKALTANHFNEYNRSAKSTVQPGDEVLYFLPRMLELLAQGAELHHSMELYLDRVGRCEADAFTSRERQAVQDFALAYFSVGLNQWIDSERSAFQNENAFTVLLMWDIGGVDIRPLLAHWLDHEGVVSTLHYVEATYWDYLEEGRQLGLAFAEDRPQFRETLEAWLEDAATKARFAKKITAFKDDEFWQSWRMQCPHRFAEESLEAVFDFVSA